MNDGSSLIGIDLMTGEPKWTFRAQWLYTPIKTVGHSIIFGTAGGHGSHLRRHDAETGATEWEVKMKGGCPHFASFGDDLVAGDWSGVLRRVRAASGDVIEESKFGAPLTSEPLVVGSRVYLLRWPIQKFKPSLLAVDLEK